MSIAGIASPHEEHQRRIRRRSRLISWGGVPLLFLALAIWWLFSLAVCMPGDAVGPIITPTCNNFHLLPDATIVVVVILAVYLIFALNLYAEAVSGRTKAPKSSIVAHFARNSLHTYGRLDAKHKSHVSFAVEMAAWSLVAIGATPLVAKHYEFHGLNSWGLHGINLYGVILTALVLRLLYALYRWTRTRLAPPSAKVT